MADDGRKVGDNSVLLPKTVEDNVCAPCAQYNRRVSAVKFCVECNEDVCERCVADHQKYGGMKGHQIMDTIRKHKDQKRVMYPSQRCTKHGGKVIDVFCADHDFVGCATCIAVEHRSCVNVKFIPDMASKELTDTLLDDLNSKFAELIKRVDALKKAKKDCVEQLSQTKEEIVKEIKEFRQKLTEKLDQMEKETLELTDDFFEKKQQSIDTLLNNIGDTRSKLLEDLESLHSCLNNNIPTRFVESKRSQAVLRVGAQAVGSLEQESCVVSVKIQMSKKLEDILQSQTMLGCLHEMPVLHTLVSTLEYNIRLPNDSNTCDVRDICMTKNGDIVLTDRANNKVKLFDSNFTLKEAQVTPGVPVGICEIDQFQLAVALHNTDTVQFLSQNPLTLKKSFKVGDHCRGLAFYNERLYICCGGLKSSSEGRGRIEVYDLSGSLHVSFYGSFICPWYIYLSENDTIYISDFNGTVVTEVYLFGGKSFKRSISYVGQPSGFSKVGLAKQICVSCYKTNTIVLLQEGSKVRKLLTKKNGVSKPRSVAFDHSQNRLIVSKENSDIISVFKYVD